MSAWMFAAPFVIGFLAFIGVSAAKSAMKKKPDPQDDQKTKPYVGEGSCNIREVFPTREQLHHLWQGAASINPCDEIPLGTHAADKPAPTPIPPENIFISQDEWNVLRSRLKSKPVGEIGSTNFVKLNTGDNNVRLLPPLAGQKFHVARQQHYVDGHGHPAYQCNKRHEGGRWVGECPICAHYHELWKDIDKLQRRGVDYETILKKQAEARTLKPVERYYYNVIVKGESTPKMLAIGKHLNDQIVKAMCGEEDSPQKPLGDISHPIDGRNITIRKTMKEGFPVYSTQFGYSTPLGTSKEVSEWMSGTFDLEAVAKKWERTTEELRAAITPESTPQELAWLEFQARQEKEFLSALAALK